MNFSTTYIIFPPNRALERTIANSIGLLSAEAAAAAVRRKLPSLHGVPPSVARRRLAAFLERRGFSAEIILAVCRAQFRGAEESSEG